MNIRGRHFADGEVTGAGTISVVSKSAIIIDLLSAASGDVDIILDSDFELFDALTVKTLDKGAVGDTIQIKDGSDNAVTAAWAIGDAGGAIGDVDRCVSIVSTYASFSKGDTLRITRVLNTNNACRLILLGTK